jgi:hypothetical protein
MKVNNEIKKIQKVEKFIKFQLANNRLFSK